MNKTKLKILYSALSLYNQEGIANVSIRKLAKEVGISHSNLIYHFPTQEDIIIGLHDMLLENAINLNREIVADKSSIIELYNTTKTGFQVVYQYRFLFYELQYICSSFPKVKQLIISVEKVRSEMYRNVIEQLIDKGLMRTEEFEDEYDRLITLIRIFSDNWLVSSSIYDEEKNEVTLEKYSHLLLTYLYPYLTRKGKEEFKMIQAVQPM